MSHIAIPFSPDDPVYGRNGSSVGAQTPRGEIKVLYLSPDYFLRLRYNPFFEWQAEQISNWLSESRSRAASLSTPSSPDSTNPFRTKSANGLEHD